MSPAMRLCVCVCVCVCVCLWVGVLLRVYKYECLISTCNTKLTLCMYN